VRASPAPDVSTHRAQDERVVVEARGLRRRFARTWALRGLDLTVERGEIVALLGANGSGKTTLLRILATVARPSGGELRLFGVAPDQDPGAVRRRLGVLAHTSGLYGELSAVENLRFAALMYGLALPERALRARLAEAGLARAADARVGTYSQGMLQRLALLRATLHDPDLVLLDEPYTALDGSGLALVDRFLAALRSAHKTAIVATHAVERSLRHCDRAVVLTAGRVTYDGPPGAAPASALPPALEQVP
jgi:heme exporter protein A